MNKCALWITAVLLAVSAQAPASHAGDSINLTRPDPDMRTRVLRAIPPHGQPGQERPEPITPEGVGSAVDRRIRSLFDRAADPATQRVTVASAEKAGVGYFADHFREIDRDESGSLDFAEVKAFFGAQSPIAQPESAGIQMIR
ncbi:hypothetical protein ACTJJ7_22945 [Phyllobacterium sp. 22229]|jgi:hypothetical protein|uniref:hypothetical protein n=1 Tax=Phyllobacterium TaxID=28100 RepID=UPI001028B9C1|nr:hypothetical protein [Phyllobacterium myrsinacearum]RZS87796.1 hypothetical protein EV217_0172 [Phyllobacterium myrsinacearum]